MRWLLTAAALFVLIPSLCSAQSAPANEPTTIHTDVRLVLVPALVQTPTKDIVYSLKADNFLLTDQGVPQKITLEPPASQPLSLVVLLQTGGAAVHQLQYYHHLETMLAEILGTPPNQVSIVAFDSIPEGVSPFSSDIAQWTDAINQPDPGNSGAAIIDTVKYGLDLLNHQPPQNRRAILLICQPQDVGSKTTSAEILRLAGETNTTIYTITFSPTKTTLKNSLKESPHGNQPLKVGSGTYVAYFDLTEPFNMIVSAMRKNVAAELASLSGGEAFTFDNQNQLDDALAALNTHLRNRYLLTFTPTSTAPGLHQLQLHVTGRPELIVSSRNTYWSGDLDKAPDEH